MKHLLRTIALLALVVHAVAQPAATGPWVEVNATNISTPASFAFYQLVTLSPTFTWGIAYDANSASSSPAVNNSIRAVNAAGTEFDISSISGTAGFKPTNITVPAGVAGNLTAFCGQYSLNGTSGRGGEVLRTTNGASWQRITATTLFAGPDSFCDWVYMFDANAGIAAGDPNPVPPGGVGQFEFLYTSNASAQPAAAVAWARATTPTPYDAREYPLIGSYTAVGNTIWAGTSHEVSGGPSGASRVLRSTDRGHTWTAANTPMSLGQVQHLAFKDALHGVAFTRNASSTELMTTSDGGLTWTLQTLPNPGTADTLRGKFYGGGVAAVPGVGFISYGAALSGNRSASNFGASFSSDGVGQSWKDIDKGHRSYLAASFLACGPAGYQGYLGSITSAATSTSGGGQGGLFQVTPGACAALPLATHSPTAPILFSVAPNPSPTGRFQLLLADNSTPGTSVLVVDALGRRVFYHELATPAIGTPVLTVDLSHQPPGLYTLRLITSTGTATRRLVIQ